VQLQYARRSPRAHRGLAERMHKCCPVGGMDGDGVAPAAATVLTTCMCLTPGSTVLMDWWFRTITDASEAAGPHGATCAGRAWVVGESPGLVAKKALEGPIYTRRLLV
jgi:hypothetical protein